MLFERIAYRSLRSFCRAMLCISAAYAVVRCLSVCLSVCVSVTFVDCVKTNKHIFEIFIPLGSHTILVFPYQTGWQYSDENPPNGGVECRWGRQKTQFWTNIWLYWTFVSVFLGHFRTNLHQTRTQYSLEGPQHWNAAQFPKKNAF